MRDSCSDLLQNGSRSWLTRTRPIARLSGSQQFNGLTPIQSLFDFSRTNWVEMYSRSSIRSFDEELELYEMLDLDADGEEDVDVNVDEDTGDILMG
jgi:hypothetical protein